MYKQEVVKNIVNVQFANVLVYPSVILVILSFNILSSITLNREN